MATLNETIGSWVGDAADCAMVAQFARDFDWSGFDGSAEEMADDAIDALDCDGSEGAIERLRGALISSAERHLSEGAQ